MLGVMNRLTQSSLKAPRCAHNNSCQSKKAHNCHLQGYFQACENGAKQFILWATKLFKLSHSVTGM